MRKMQRKTLLFLAIILFISIGFAVLTTNLSINGLFNFTPNTWSIKLKNVVVDDTSVTKTAPTINQDEDSVTFSAELNKPGDYYSFNFDVLNESTLDAMLGSITVSGITSQYSDYLSCVITYSNGTIPNPNDILYKTARVTLNVKLLYKDITTSQIPENVLNPTITITVNYRQANSNAVLVADTNHWDFYYSGAERTFNIPLNGIYKIETWGAQGSTSGPALQYVGGYGGYSIGTYNGEKNQSIYIQVGGNGRNASTKGYNGGGISNGSIDHPGGGATHMALEHGLLATLEPYKGTLTDDSYYISDKILIVSGGGGGNDYVTPGNYDGSGGGYIGNSGIYGDLSLHKKAIGGTQTSAGTSYDNTYPDRVVSSAFGQGATDSSTLDCGGSGGGGFYGGGATVGWGLGAGGSGYIASSLNNSNTTFSITKHMTCYRCQTTNDDEIKTQSTTCHKNNPTPDCAKEGDGFARITILVN